ncbi:MFS transporter [Candidatus Thorarchaeota archaeon]|nr:MAG: MFS transporter [Candidatus Thorarchaeota archaeon]
MVKTETIQIMAGAAVLSAFTYVPILARDVLGANELYVTLLAGSYGMAAFIASYIFGRAGDIYGRRIILRLGLLLATVTFGLLFFASSPEMLFIVRTLNGFSMGMYPGALAAYAYESKMKMGRFASFGALGWGAGTVLAGYAAGFNIYYAFVVSSLFFIIAFGSALTLPTVQQVEIDVPRFPIKTIKRNLPVYLAVLIRHSSAHALWTLWPLFLSDLGGDLLIIGLVQASNSISQVVFMLGMTDRMDYKRLVTLGLLSTAATFVWFALVTDIYQIFPAQVLLGFSWACLYVGALKYVTENNEERATASGILTSVMSMAQVIGPVITAVLYLVWPGYTTILLFGATMSVIALTTFLFTSRRAERISSESMEPKDVITP